MVPEDELDAIAALIAPHPDGVQVAAIRAELEFSLPPRMLQRRLKRLVEDGRITTEGSGKGQRYFPLPGSPTEPRKALSPAPSKGEIPLSTEAQTARRIVCSPLSARRPAGYDPTFLEGYEPNKSAYLDPFRLRYRAQIGAFIREVIKGGMDRRVAARTIATRAAGEIAESDRARLIEVIETELINLHEGSIARYRLRPGEFNDWKQGWR